MASKKHLLQIARCGLSGTAPIHTRSLVAAVFLSIACIAALAIAAEKTSSSDSEQTVEKERAALCETLRSTVRAVEDLSADFGETYPRGGAWLDKLHKLERRIGQAKGDKLEALRAELQAVQREALLANPLVTGHAILFVVRRQYKPDHHNTETMFQNGEISTDSFEGGGAIKTIDLGQDGLVTPLVDAPEGVARDPDVRFDGERILFSMRRNKADDYHVYEMNPDGSDLRQLTFGKELTDIDPFYMPGGAIGFSSTREPKYCQCNRHVMANLFVMNADGGNIRQTGHNPLFEGHGSVMPDGRVLYDRWEYVDRHFGPSFGLWTANPDGTGHALYYGNNAWSPGGIIDAHVVPGTSLVVATFTSCHDRPWGALAVVDRRLGLDGTAPVVQSWPADISRFLNTQGYAGIDVFKEVEPKYEDPYPLSAKYFLCSRAVQGERMGIFLIDVFGNEVLLHSEEPGCFDPMPVAPRACPPAIPPRVRLDERNGYFYVQDVYRGTGMENVPRGTIRYLRVIEAPAKLFWTQPCWNIDATQAPAMNWNLTNNKRILGDAPVAEDGSAYFSVPADTFLFFQALDENRIMVQSMRSGTFLQPGETAGCVGCHEHRLSAAPDTAPLAAVGRPPSELEPWYGPPRTFNYLTEVQPVFDRYCVACHDYGKEAGETLNLAGDLGLAFNTSYADLRSKSPVRWQPDRPGDPKPLVKAVDDGPPEVLPPYAWGSYRSRLVDIMRGEHHGVQPDRESLERVVTWIDLNAVYYGSYASSYPDNVFGRSPLDNAQLERLRALTGLNVGDQQLEMTGSQISFTRPECSPCLAGLKAEDSEKYREALAIIQAGQDQLMRVPRPDMPGFSLVRDVEIKQQAKHDAYIRTQAETCQAILQSERPRNAPGRRPDRMAP